jgi:hypothetical protein
MRIHHGDTGVTEKIQDRAALFLYYSVNNSGCSQCLRESVVKTLLIARLP